MTGMILDGVLMLLLVAALGYGVRLEKKLSALRAGQQAFATAVTELNAAAGRAEAALGSLRASGQETDLLHDRIVKAREVKAQLEALIARAPETSREAPRAAPQASPKPVLVAAPVAAPVTAEDERARRMAALAERIQGLNPAARAPTPVSAILGALTAGRAANQAAKQSLNQTRRNLDEDLFAA
ncbi:MAG: hypothetical protein KKE42_10205 [Alphaproteobacteria bacterium]|uniref:DUF6468 domain-containing protein n=1 Tax=Brevundimonas sp. TaxID=1871086 RepID=UPI0017F5E951|nr:DUF6468 domain-containing protein [Brevundimonas sp.]MBU3971995.1 hypothetical protein [Alphaproteobacteria bacterium]MBA3050127.1 hypothetical protein [Brevundimonas sp.]MBU3974155.1 hypothetical protein [Alphaproteobacteria bacterium]MBU4039857.1 hypothetical protein [Alphaproteobacteria bacterium]MBU4137561.1 hypothetical protein [Alphaproteobacteria bacterium]